MRSVFPISLTAVILAGCAAPAPQLPRHVTRVVEPGYASTPSQSVVPSDATARTQRTVAPQAASTPAREADSITTIQSAWDGLSLADQETLRRAATVYVMPLRSYGIITDVQSANMSTPGTSGGAALGATVAQAAYIDRAFRGSGSGYSALAQVAIGLVGAAVGSSMDRQPQAIYQTRYTIQLGDGDVEYFDQTSSSVFRHSVGICVGLPDVRLIPQQICRQTTDHLLAEISARTPAMAVAAAEPTSDARVSNRVTPARVTPTGVIPASVQPAGVVPTRVTPARAASAGATPASVKPATATPAQVTSAGVTPASVKPASVTPAKATPAAAPASATASEPAPAPTPDRASPGTPTSVFRQVALD